MSITVLYFAAARERAGTAQETVEWGGGPVRHLLETLAARHPTSGRSCPTSAWR